MEKYLWPFAILGAIPAMVFLYLGRNRIHQIWGQANIGASAFYLFATGFGASMFAMWLFTSFAMWLWHK